MSQFKSGPVIAIGSLPPPVHGNAIAFVAFVEELQSRIPVLVADIGPGTRLRGLGYHLNRFGRVLKAIFTLFRNRKRSRVVYHNVDAGLGLAYGLLIVLAARALNYRPFLHHHSYSYIDRWNWAVSLLVLFAGDNACHIMLANCMADGFRSRYRYPYEMIVVGNARLLRPSEMSLILPDGPLVLGHLSRLGRDKGLYDVVRTFDAMSRNGANIRLVVAGPAEDAESQSVIEQLIARYPDRVQWLGPVADAPKAAFYKSIDVFLFPTRYRNEAQPLVILEAMQFGRPSIAFARGAIGELLAESGGVSVSSTCDFAKSAAIPLTEWVDNRKQLRAAGEAARKGFENMLYRADGQLAQLFSLMASSQGKER